MNRVLKSSIKVISIIVVLFIITALSAYFYSVQMFLLLKQRIPMKILIYKKLPSKEGSILTETETTNLTYTRITDKQ